MGLMLGIDTGGTYTDAVLVVDGEGLDVIASAKAPTVHGDLGKGLAGAIDAVLAQAGATSASEITLVSISTTLATNALVEGHGEPAALLSLGLSAADIQRAGLRDVVAPDLHFAFDGGHDAYGNEQAALDLDAIAEIARAATASASAFAVVGQFSVRNSAHEQQVAALVREATGLPVTVSHQLSSRLNGPRRALTAVLNAQLLGTIGRLHAAVETTLAARSIDATLMVVRGDGSLVAAPFAVERPIETVLSGPAASVIGALHLADISEGLVADVGGTTTDIAVVVDGRPAVAEDGAVVGGHRTMVEAVDMVTVGLGGDSEIRVDNRNHDGPIVIGPERAIPIGRLAVTMPHVHNLLDDQLRSSTGFATHGRLVVSTAPAGIVLEDGREQVVLDRLRSGAMTENQAARTGLEQRALRRLCQRGLVRIATFTPTDASAVLSGADLEGIDRAASAKTAALMARQPALGGHPITADGNHFARRVVERFVDRSANSLLRAALASDDIATVGADELIAASLSGHAGAASVRVGLSSPVTAIGAPAETYYPAIADLAGTTAVVPSHAEVANAIGAVVGQVRIRRSVTVSQPSKGQFRVHDGDQPTFGSVERARAAALSLLEAAVHAEAIAAGAATPELRHQWHEKVATVNDKPVFVEGQLTVEAFGRPCI